MSVMHRDALQTEEEDPWAPAPRPQEGRQLAGGQGIQDSAPCAVCCL